MNNKIGVIGAGSWGTTLANLLGNKGFSVTLWVYEKDLYEKIRNNKENDLYLPGVKISPNVVPTNFLEVAAHNKEAVVIVSPSHVTRMLAADLMPHLSEDTIIISATKGIEDHTLMTMSEVLEETLNKSKKMRLTFLSGPSFASEVSRQIPTAVVIASKERKEAQKAQNIFNTPYFRVYTSLDVKGVELGGAAKNVIAIATGISDGLGFGFNTRAALITRGLQEIVRLGKKLGANPLTFSGLSGIGDLILTCTGELSRNRSVGLKLGKGEKLKNILESMTMVAEGVRSARAIYNLSLKHSIEMPIIKQTHQVLYEEKPPKEAVIELMTRSLKDELD